MSGYSLLCCVVNMGDASKAIKSSRKYGVKGGTISLGMGTVHSRLLGFLGIYEVRKEIVYMIVEDELADEAFRGVSRDMHFEKPHHGIAFTSSVGEFTGTKNTVLNKTDRTVGSEAKKNVYKIIYVVVDKGKGEDVVDAANKAGARGGTIMNARGAGIHEVQKLFSMEIEPEKEKVFIIAKTEMKDGIVNSIKSHLKLDEPGNGIIFVQDINEVYGLHED